MSEPKNPPMHSVGAALEWVRYLRAENKRLREALSKLHHTLTRPGVVGEPHLSIVRQVLEASDE